MSLYEYLDILAQGYDCIDFLWNIFIAVHLAVIGGIILINRRIGVHERLIAVTAYLSFLFVNYNSVRDGYAYQIVLLEEIDKLNVPGRAGSDLLTWLNTFDLPGRIAFPEIAYIAAAVLTTLAILCANILSRGRRRENF